MRHLILLALLLAGCTTASAAVVDEPFKGVVLTRLTNLVLPNNTALPFDTAWTMNTGYGTWSAADPTKIVVAKSGWYRVGGDFTTLGTAYGGPNNADWVAQIGRNGIDLDHAIVAERHFHSSGGTADLMSIGGPVRLEAGDTIQVVFQNANGQSLLIESNPSVPPASGSDYRTQPGTGAMSPHLYIVFEGT